MFDRRLILNFDFFLLLSVLTVCLLGVVNLYSICSSSMVYSHLFMKQLYWILIGLGLILLVVNINYLTLIQYAYYFHLASLLLLFGVLFFGQTIFGSQRWLVFGGFSLQPSETAKITMILALSKFYSENISPRPYSFKDILLPLFILVITFIPIYLQPDLGTAGMLVIIFFSLALFLNISRTTIYGFTSSALVMLPCLWFVLKDYQKRRILTFLNPELDPLNAGYQVIQSKIAVGSGGLFGKGFKLGTQSQLRFLPEQHTDFVFSVWAEEWGFVGCFFLLMLFFFILYRGLSIGYYCKNFYGSFIAIGVTFLLFSQLTLNIFMTLGLFPVVGVPLPFFSYGGSSMLSSMLGIGLLLNINMRKFK